MSDRIPSEALNISDEIEGHTSALVGVFAALAELSGPGDRAALYRFVLREAEAIDAAHQRLFDVLRGEVGE